MYVCAVFRVCVCVCVFVLGWWHFVQGS